MIDQQRKAICLIVLSQLYTYLEYPALETRSVRNRHAQQNHQSGRHSLYIVQFSFIEPALDHANFLTCVLVAVPAKLDASETPRNRLNVHYLVYMLTT
jgi:hypothetical protein